MPHGLDESGRHVTWFANQELDILSLCLRVGRCLVELYNGTVCFLRNLVVTNKRSDSIPETVPWCNWTQHRPSLTRHPQNGQLVKTWLPWKKYAVQRQTLVKDFRKSSYHYLCR